MKLKWTTFAFLASIAVCHAQDISISGVVKAGGSGIEGAMVRLGLADISTITDKDGKFTLSSQTGVSPRKDRAASSDNRLFILKNNRLFFSASQQSAVGISVYDVNGKRLLSRNTVASGRDHSIALPGFADGIYLYRIHLNNHQYTFRSVGGVTISSAQETSSSSIAPSTPKKATAQLDDALLFTKAGYQLQRLKITKPDTSGIQVTLTPFETGTVNDGEGNVYQTLKIGKLIWTIENIRSTKYNDGSAIAQGSYCFYKNTTDAAEKKKWGALYSGSVALNSKLAPTGWHVATAADWDTLQNYLITNGYNYDGTLSENKIAKSMSTATSDWQTFAEEGAIGNDITKNNASGFSGLPGGLKTFDGDFIDQNVIGYWWTSTKKDGTYTFYRILYYTNFDLYPSYRVNTNSCSIRLVKNN